jgi:hypothetical protein
MMQRQRPIEKIALFAPNRSALYVSGLLGLRRQFARRGIDCHVGWTYFDPDQMAQFCDLFRPDAVLEIDRTRNNAAIPDDVVSIAWIQDWRSMSEDKIGNSSDRFGGSDLYYFCAKPETLGIDVKGLKHWSYLLQATDPDLYFSEGLPEESDFSLIGYIPAKMHLEQIDHPLGVQLLGPPTNTSDFGTIRQLLDAFRAHGLTWNKYDAAEARRIANRHVCSFFDSRAAVIGDVSGGCAEELQHELLPLVSASLFDRGGRCLVPDITMYNVENEVMRAIGRSSVVNAVLKVSQSVRLYGIGMWQTYPEYEPYYKGAAPTETMVRRIYGTTRINLHNAMTQMHARVLDCMATGSAIMVNKMLHNDASQPDCLKAHFEADLHYFEYDEDDLDERARAVLDADDKRRKAGRLAAEAVRAKHTWSHRVDQILSDVTQL